MKFKEYIKSGMPYYKRMILIAIPIMIQNGITNFVSMLDNIMVGRVGTLQMTGVSIVNQLLLVFNLCIFGAMSGVGIFTAQFFGKKDNDGVKSTLQFKLVSSVVLIAIGLLVFTLFGDFFITAYLQGEGSPEDIALVMGYSKSYLKIMLIGIAPFALSQAYAGTMRETNDRILPMIATVSAVLVNLVFNYLLIFGKFGFPELGIEGAAIATVLSRFVELAILIIWGHTHKNSKYPFIKGVFSSFTLTKKEIGKIAIITLPLLVNEALWSAGMAMLNQCYSIRGLDVVAAVNIVSTLSNVFNVSFIAFGSAVGIILSQMLGAKQKDEARTAAEKLLFFSVFIVTIIAVFMAMTSSLFPKIYNTTDEVRSLASSLILTVACFFPVMAFTNSCYFTLRSGGKTLVTFVFDSGFVWFVSIPLAFVLSRFTAVPIVPLYACVLTADIVKCILGYALMHKGVWLNTVVE